MKLKYFALSFFIVLSISTFLIGQNSDPRVLDVPKAVGAITVDGIINEPSWGLAPTTLVFGLNPPLTTTRHPVTGGVMVKLDSLKGYDTTHTMVRVIRNGMRLHFAIESNDRSVCRFGDSWEGDGVFMKIRNAAGNEVEYKLYFNAAGLDPNIVYEATNSGHGAGAGRKGTNTRVNDTTQIDNGYTAELVIFLDSLGFNATHKSFEVLINVFDPDFYHAGMLPWGPRGTFHKMWWGNEWGPVNRTLRFLDDPSALTVLTTPSTITVDGNLNEPGWNFDYEHLVFGPGQVPTVFGRTVTGGTLVHGNYPDTTTTTVRFLRQGARLFVGIRSNDRSVGRFGDSWEGDGLFMKILNSAAQEREYKLYFNAGGVNPGIVYEASNPAHGFGAGLRGSNTIVNDTTQIDNGYTAELVIFLDSLGFTAANPSVQVLLNIFDPDGYMGTMPPWGPRGTFHKSWWGNEWGPPNRTLNLSATVIPVELVSFVAKPTSNGVEINWETASETNNKGFEVQRSYDQTNFEQIGFVAGKGTSTARNIYSFVDRSASNNVVYYRLKQVDYDGTFAFSQVINVENTLPTVFALNQNYPNPFNPTTKITFSLASNSEVTIDVYNAIGQLVQRIVETKLSAGNHEVSFDASTLTSGVYIYRMNAIGIDGSNFKQVKKMMLVR